MTQGSDTQRSDRGLRRVRCPVWPCGVLAARAAAGRVQPVRIRYSPKPRARPAGARRSPFPIPIPVSRTGTQ